MGWLNDRWGTLKEAAGYRRYLIGGAALTVLALVDAISGYRVMTWLTGVPAWAVVLIVVLFSVAFWLLNYATALRKQAEPKVAILGLEFWPGDMEDARYVSVVVKNTSTQDISGLRARLYDVMEGSRPISSSLAFPVSLWIRQQLREMRAGGTRFPQPFAMNASDDRRLEVFQIIGGKDVQIYDRDNVSHIPAIDALTFKCKLFGGGLPTEFTLEYHTRDNGGCIDLKDGKGKVIDAKAWSSV